MISNKPLILLVLLLLDGEKLRLGWMNVRPTAPGRSRVRACIRGASRSEHHQTQVEVEHCVLCATTTYTMYIFGTRYVQ